MKLVETMANEESCFVDYDLIILLNASLASPTAFCIVGIFSPLSLSLVFYSFSFVCREILDVLLEDSISFSAATSHYWICVALSNFRVRSLEWILEKGKRFFS